MKIIKKNLTLGITIALISVITIAIGATKIYNTKNTHTRFYVRPVEKAKVIEASMVNYKGQMIPHIHLHEIIVSEKAIQKKK